MKKEFSKLYSLVSEMGKAKEVDINAAKSEIIGESSIQIRLLPVKEIRPDPGNARLSISEQDEDIHELAASIRAKGLLQPLVVKKDGAGYKVIVGHRRLAALNYLEIEHVECKIFPEDTPEEHISEMQLIENLQRKDLSPLEEARAYQRYIDKTGVKQRELAQKLGIGEAVISQVLKVLKLPPERQKKIEELNLRGRLLRKAVSIKSEEEFARFLEELSNENEGQQEDAQKEKELPPCQLPEKTLSKEKNFTPCKVFSQSLHEVEEFDSDTYHEFFSLLAYDIHAKGKEEALYFLSESGKQYLNMIIQEWKAKR